jgi:hypothetical protein
MGIRLIDLPMASQIALQTAAAAGTIGGSATPRAPYGPTASPCSMSTLSTFGSNLAGATFPIRVGLPQQFDHKGFTKPVSLRNYFKKVGGSKEVRPVGD